MLEMNRDVTAGRCYLVRGRANVLTLLGSADWQAHPILEFHDLAPLQGSISARVATWTLSAAQTDAVRIRQCSLPSAAGQFRAGGWHGTRPEWLGRSGRAAVH